MSTSWHDIKSKFEGKISEKSPETLKKCRQHAFSAFEKYGLPQRQNERWRATPLKHLFSTQFKHQAPLSKFKSIEFSEAVYQIQLKSGKVDIHNIPDGVVLMSMEDAWVQHPQCIEKYFGSVASTNEALTLLNTSLFSDGIFLWVPEGVHVDQPIMIHHQADVDQLHHYRHLMVFEHNSSATLLEIFNNREKGSGFINHVCEMVIKEQAKIEHYQAQILNDESYLQSELSVQQHGHSKLDAFLLQLGGQYSTCDMNMSLEAEYSQCRVSGIYSPHLQQFHQQRLNVRHMESHCQSMQNFRGIADDKAHGVFMGQVYVHDDAQKTEAHQSNRNLILSKQAEITTMPQLQIFADDVICSHGATVGQLDDDSLFYLQSRGFSLDDAKNALVHAFLMEQFQYILNDAIKNWFIQMFEQRREVP